MEKPYSLTKQTIVLMAGKGAGFLLAFVIPLVIVRLTTPEEFGTYKQFVLIFSTVFFIAQLGVTQSIYYFVPQNERKATFITQAYLCLTLSGLISLGGLCLSAGEIAELLNNPDLKRYAFLIGLFLFFMVAASFLEGSLIAESKIKAASLILFLTELFKAAFMLIPIAITSNLLFLFLGVVCFSSFRFLFTSFYIRKHLLSSFKSISLNSFSEQLRYSLPLGISMIFFILSFNLQNYFVSFYFPPEIYAVFAVGLFYPPILEVIEGPVIEPMFVAIVKNLRIGNEEAISQVWHNSVRKISLAMFPILAFSFIESRQIISVLFTKIYLASVPIFMIAIFRIFFAVFIPDNIIKAFGKTRYILKIDITTLIIYSMILFIFIKAFGLIGAAFAMIANQLIMKTLLVNKARMLLKLSVISCLPWRHLALCIMICFMSTLPVLVYNHFYPNESIFNILVCLMIFLLTYSYFLFKSPLLAKNEKEAIISYFSQKHIFLLTARKRLKYNKDIERVDLFNRFRN